jgi:hypothetical protein
VIQSFLYSTVDSLEKPQVVPVDVDLLGHTRLIFWKLTLFFLFPTFRLSLSLRAGEGNF